MGRDPFLTERTEQRPTGETQRQGAGKLDTSFLIETASCCASRNRKSNDRT